MSELDKTIEELEAEVQAELEEAKQPTDGADKGDSKMEKVDGEVQDTGAAVVTPDEKKGADAAKSIKPAKDAQNKGAKDAGGDTEPTKIKEPLAAGNEIEHDGEELEEARMTKETMKAEMQKKMEGMKVQELKAAYEAMCNGEGYGATKEEDEEEMDESTLEDRLASVDVSEDVSALTEGEELSEEFKGKAATIFEAAVKSKLRSEVARIESEKTQEVAEEINKVRDELTEKVDAYMNYVVEEWMKENELAIERGLKGEIAEDFITGLKSLFEEHYIDVPDEKYDILEAQSEKIDELESKINEQIEKSASLKKQNDQLVRESVFAKVSSDLADTEVEKFKSLAEDVDFSDEETFEEKLNTLKESYFPKATTIAESVDSESDGSDAFDTTGAMAAYMNAISKNVKRAK
jgi:hypothetical protein